MIKEETNRVKDIMVLISGRTAQPILRTEEEAEAEEPTTGTLAEVMEERLTQASTEVSPEETSTDQEVLVEEASNKEEVLPEEGATPKNSTIRTNFQRIQVM